MRFFFCQCDEQQQEEAVSTNKFELPANFETELNQFFSLEENGDGNFVNINQVYAYYFRNYKIEYESTSNQRLYIWSKNVLLTYIFDFVLKGHSEGEPSNIVAAPETNYPVFNMNPNHEQVL